MKEPTTERSYSSAKHVKRTSHKHKHKRQAHKYQLMFYILDYLDLYDTMEEAMYRKRYFDQPSWDDIEPFEDIKTDSKNLNDKRLHLKGSCELF